MTVYFIMNGAKVVNSNRRTNMSQLALTSKDSEFLI